MNRAMNMLKKWVLVLFVIIFLAFIPDKNIVKDEFPSFRVVIDPGHGGVLIKDKKKHGDRFDMLSGEYLDYYADGASYKNIHEHKIVYSIAVKVNDLLSNCSKDGDFEKFKKILMKYTDGNIKKIYIETILSRDESISGDSVQELDDPNANYRLYDFPDTKGKMQKGRISKINQYKPHLVVSLHLARSAPPDYKGMNGIIVPPYNVLKKGLVMLQTGDHPALSGATQILNSWFRDFKKTPPKFAFLKDVSYHFTSYGMKKDYSINTDDFKGYKYNMVTWRYRDRPKWHLTAEKHPADSRYSSDYKTFKEEGDFWEREQSLYEEYRRGTGFKDFGGDNYFATYEIIKYTLLSLNKAGNSHKDKIPGKPYISTWSMPMLINAISAYIELGYLDRKWDREILLYQQDKIAEGVAVGIYSLLAGIENIKGNYKNKPAGKCIDLKKYNITKDKNYFDIVDK